MNITIPVSSNCFLRNVIVKYSATFKIMNFASYLIESYHIIKNT